MGEKFCPKCGRKTEKFYENLCGKCFLSKLSFIDKIPDKILVKKCRNCGRYFFEKEKGESMEELIESIIRNFLRWPEVEKIRYEIEDDKLHVSLDIRFEDLRKIEEKDIKLRTKTITCKQCSMINLGYYRAIVQVRAPQEILGRIYKEIEEKVNLLRKYDELSFISKVVKSKSGFDVFIGSKEVAREIARDIKKKYVGKIKISRKLSGSIRGKKVYRDTIMIRIGEQKWGRRSSN